MRTRHSTLRTIGAAALLSACLLLPASSALAAGDVNHPEPCPPETESSPGFRTYLPDCRAYELVSPPYVGGGVPFGQGSFSKRPLMTANGEHLLAIDFAGFAGTENEEEPIGFEYGATYEFSRTPTGWTTEALEPPASQYPRSEFLFPSADLSRILWKVFPAPHDGEELALPPQNDALLAVRDRAGAGRGRFTVLGPVAAPGHEAANRGGAQQYYIEGGSADLGHILFGVRNEYKQLWPGDQTLPADESLYEYQGTAGHEPVLVGVSNEGPLTGSPVNAEAKLVSRCGAELGSSHVATAYNAVSAGGGVVYFTAKECAGGPPVNELYARVDASHTVAISESTSQPGGDCEECVESTPRAAVFEGASEDGSKVFFLSEQKMFGGTRGEAGQNLYEYDFHATSEHERVTLIAPDVTSVTPPSENGARVYFQSTATLPTGPNANGEEPAEKGTDNLYLYEAEPGHAARTAYVAQQPTPVDASRDGRYAVFESPLELKGTGDTSKEVNQLFEYDAETGSVTRVSIGQGSPSGYECPATHVVEPGYDCNGNTENPHDAPSMVPRAGEPSAAYSTSELSVSASGTVVFVSRDTLTPSSVAGGENIYEYRAGDVYLVSPGDEGPAAEVNWDVTEQRLGGIDETGSDVFFRSSDSLVPQDTDTQSSFYDAREGGGFPAPPTPAGCTPGSCQGPLSAPPPLPAAGGSAATSGVGDPPASTPAASRPAIKPRTKACKKGYVKKKGKCVKAPKSKKAKRASTKRGADS